MTDNVVKFPSRGGGRPPRRPTRSPRKDKRDETWEEYDARHYDEYINPRGFPPRPHPLSKVTPGLEITIKHLVLYLLLDGDSNTPPANIQSLIANRKQRNQTLHWAFDDVLETLKKLIGTRISQQRRYRLMCEINAIIMKDFSKDDLKRLRRSLSRRNKTSK
jgi:hypothetical protein